MNNSASRFNDPLSLEEMFKALADLASIHQMQFRKDREAARRDDIENSRGFLILNPDINTEGVDVEGLVVTRKEKEHEGKEYRVVFDPSMEGMRDKETGKICTGFWLEPMKPFDLINFAIDFSNGQDETDFAFRLRTL